MGREKRSGPGPLPGGHAKERHKKRLRAQTVSNPPVLNARPEVHNLKSKHHSYYEIVENKDKKKKLEFEITSKRTPPPGFEFVPIGNPELTQACKELSRERDAMIFIVSYGNGGGLSQQMNRVGHHIRSGIVEEARREVSDNGDSSDGQLPLGAPEPIPESQEEINAQADLAIRDLFPRIPNTDRQTIIEHSFKKGATKKGEPLVGLARDIPLSRRVQLAVLAHIRHTHTRYDSLLRETTYLNARKAVEGLCLDVLVKWRGDEENGRDQLDEILREVIVISDSEDDGDDDGEDGEDEEADSSGVESGDLAAEPSYLPYPAAPSSRMRMDARQPLEARRPRPLVYGERASWRDEPDHGFAPPQRQYISQRNMPAINGARRGFKRYEAALSARWGAAVDRARHQNGRPPEAAPPQTVEYRLYPSSSRQEPRRQEQGPPPGRLYYVDNAAEFRSLRGGEDNSPRPMDYPARGPIPARMASDVVHRRSPSGGLSRGASPYADPRQTQQPQRVVVRSSEARDFLVPSVEPLSLSSEQPPAAPVFVRTVSPRQVSRPPRGPVDDGRAPYDLRSSPTRNGEIVTLKRRRVPMDDESYPPRDPPRHEAVPMRRLASDGWQRPPVHYAVSRPREESPRIVSDRDSRGHLPPRPPQRVIRVPVSAADGGRAYYESPRYDPPLGSERAPIVLDDSEMGHTPAAATFPVRDYRGSVIPERREPAYQAADTRYQPPPTEYRRPLPAAGYSGSPNPQDRPVYNENHAPRSHDALPIRLGPSQIERPGAYDQQPPYANAPEPRPVYHPPAYEPAPPPPPPPSQYQHQSGYEPAPVFVRPVERHDQPPPLEPRGQPEWHHNTGPPHEYQPPPPGGGWAHLAPSSQQGPPPGHPPPPPPQGNYHDQPPTSAYQPTYPPYPSQPPPDEYIYGGYPEHHNHQQHYNQSGQ